MNIDWRILASVTLFTALGVTLLTTVRLSSMDMPEDVEAELLSNKKTSVKAQNGLILELNPSGIDVLVENCSAEKFSDKFFLHATSVNNHNTPQEGFHNFDFYLNKVRGFQIDRDGQKYCLHPISFNRIKVKEIKIGQFSMPNSECCKILWSTDIKL